MSLTGRTLRWLPQLLLIVIAPVSGAIGLLLLAALLGGVVLVPVFGLGVPVFDGALRAIRAVVGIHRRVASWVLGAESSATYLSEPGWTRRSLIACLRDPQTWRDAAWLGTHGAIGSVIFVAAFGLVRAVIIVAPVITSGDPLFNIAVNLVLALLVATLVWVVPWVVHVSARLARMLLSPAETPLVGRIRQLTESRAAAVDAQAAELRRIERDLHDGAQARLAAVGMTLGLAAQALPGETDRAAALLEEARADAGRALTELRHLVRGIHPPVLADRGLAGGLEAAALLCPVPVEVDVLLGGRVQAPVESALYFAAAEALANVGRHSGAMRARLTGRHDGRNLRIVVSDDGTGGADPACGTGLRGIAARLSAFDGVLHISSPSGGPTEITMELPCRLVPPTPQPHPTSQPHPTPSSVSSSPKTTSCSATD